MTIRPGDVLFYFDASGLTKLIEVGEQRQEQSSGPWPIHVAIALGTEEKLEADFWDTAVNPIGTRKYVLCRPPYPDPRKLAKALIWGQTRVGRLYGWIGVSDQGLRDISGGRLHLPRRFIEWADNVWPFCSTLVESVVRRAGFTDIPLWPPPSPADCWVALKDYQVSG